MIYTGGTWSIWLATREGTWGWLADSITHYFRMALVHLGLPGWQAAFANLPLIPWAEVRSIFNYFFLNNRKHIKRTYPKNKTIILSAVVKKKILATNQKHIFINIQNKRVPIVIIGVKSKFS